MATAKTAATLLLSVLVLQTTSPIFLAASTAPLSFTAELIRTPRSRLRLLSGSPYSDAIANHGAYAMRMKIGTPPLEIQGLADTGSNTVWVQCLPCISCRTQNHPLFDPTKSSTYKDMPCDSSQCQSVRSVRCNSKDGACPYGAFYGDPDSYSVGHVGTDTATLSSTSGKPFVLPGLVLGCGNNNSLSNPELSGIIGLGWGPASLVSQMGDRIQGLFSYCLGPETSKINFGANAVVSGDGTVSTTLFRKQDGLSGFYYLNLEAISVDGSRVETAGTSFQATDGNIIIDSGTTYTFLPEDYYLRLKEAVVKAVKSAPPAPDTAFSEPCFKSTSFLDFPVITMHFPGADLVTESSKIYRKLGRDKICLSIRPVSGLSTGVAILGNRAQTNFLIGHDTESNVISFKHVDCSAL